MGLTTLGLCGGWKARAAWEEVTDASKPASVLARVPGYFSESESGGDDAKDRRITELEAKLHAASEKNEELQMCLDAQSNRHEFPRRRRRRNGLEIDSARPVGGTHDVHRLC